MQPTAERLYFIDWVRVLAFALLIVFHCAMPFVNHGWEVKNSTTSQPLTRVIWWLHQWRLPLLFFVCGIGIQFSLRKRSVLAFAGERIIRLFIPLLFAMFFTIPLQVYFEKLQEGKISGSYIDFYPTVWSFVPYPEGTLSWSHMWFVVYLFVFCILLLPVFGLFKIKKLEEWKNAAAEFLSKPLLLSVFLLPMIYYYITLYIKWPEQGSLLDDWFIFLFYLTLLFYGYFLAGSKRIWDTCMKYRNWFLGIIILTMIPLYAFYWWKPDFPKQNDERLYTYAVLNSVLIWTTILAILGFAKKHLNYSNRFLQYFNEAVYPYYILHQTVIVALGYYIVQWSVPISIKLIVLIISSIAIITCLYHFVIRPFIITRFLYGMKLKKKKAQSERDSQ